VDYQTGPFEDAVRDMDVVFDTLAGEMQARSWVLLKAGGILVSTLGIAEPDAAARHGVRATGIACSPDGVQFGRIAGMIDVGQVRPNVGAVLSLADAAKAKELNRTGAIKGKIVLTLP